MRALKLIICGGLLWASAAQAVSQVGGGKMWNPDQGFSADVPADFQNNAQIFASDDLRLNKGVGFGGSGSIFQSRKINVWILDHQLPDVATIPTRQEFADWFTARAWNSFSTADSCIEAYAKDNGSTLTVIAGWGDGHGLILTGENVAEVTTAIETIARSLKLDAGACRWK